MNRVLRELLSALSNRVPDLPFEVRFWDGAAETYGSGSPFFTVTFKTEGAVKSLLRRGTLGFREEYGAGNVDLTGDLQQLFRLGSDPRCQDMKLPLRARAAMLLQYLASLNTLKKARANIAHHYNLGNDFYRLYLDESMAYSCAYFKSDADSLETAQEQKYEHICRKLRLREGETLIDVGCGWGGMLIYAARRYGVKGLGCTLSSHQAEYARERAAEEGLGKKITILLEDYRKIEGSFDKFVSIGMFEHVGKKFIPLFMDKIREILKPGGIGLLHTVGKERYTPGDAWTNTFIFPGAYIPMLDRVTRTMGERGLVPVDIENLRLHYAATLDEWARRFERNAQKIEAMFDSLLVRRWRLFLQGSAAAFRWGDIRLYQILFTNGLNNSLPLTRDHLYQS